MAMTPAQHVARNVRRLRQSRGWSLGELSARLGKVGHPLSVPVLSKMELGAEEGRTRSTTRGVDVDDLVALASALEVSPSKLLSDDENYWRTNLSDVMAEWLQLRHRVDFLLADVERTRLYEDEMWDAAAEIVDELRLSKAQIETALPPLWTKAQRAEVAERLVKGEGVPDGQR